MRNVDKAIENRCDKYSQFIPTSSDVGYKYAAVFDGLKVKTYLNKLTPIKFA